MFNTDYPDLIMFTIDWVVSKPVSHLFTCNLVTNCVWNWHRRILKVYFFLRWPCGADRMLYIQNLTHTFMHTHTRTHTHTNTHTHTYTNNDFNKYIMLHSLKPSTHSYPLACRWDVMIQELTRTHTQQWFQQIHHVSQSEADPVYPQLYICSMNNWPWSDCLWCGTSLFQVHPVTNKTFQQAKLTKSKVSMERKQHTE